MPERAGSVHQTQKEAWDVARQMLQQKEAVSLTVMGIQGKIVSKDTIASRLRP